MNLSEHFTLEELTFSAKAVERNMRNPCGKFRANCYTP